MVRENNHNFVHAIFSPNDKYDYLITNPKTQVHGLKLY